MASSSLGDLIGATPEMRALFERLSAIVQGTGNLVLQGETGTGRETLARAVHAESRTEQPFVVVDLAGMPPRLVDSALFGYEMTTFLGGLKVTRGAFETAESGTVVLHEVAAIPLELQPRFAEALRTRSYVRVGAIADRPINARVIATTHVDLDELVAGGRFDADLHRVLARAGTFAVPPLRDRLEDLPLLVERFAKRALAPAQLARLAALPWPGNLGELERAVAAILEAPARSDAITELELLAAIAAVPDDDAPRLVYADLLADRGDPRGELIQVQCRLARGEGETRRLHAAERRLLDAHAASWAAPAIEVASDAGTPATAVFRRGFVEASTAPVAVLQRLDRLFERAPVLDELDLVGIPGAQHLVSPLLRRLRGLRFQLTSYDGAEENPAPAPELLLIAACPHLVALRSLTLAAEAFRTLTTAETIAGLARSPHLASLRDLTLVNVSIWDDALGTLLDDRARWQLAELALRGCYLDAGSVGRLISAPGARALRALDLEGNSLGAAGLFELAAAEPLSSLEILRIANVDADWNQVAPGPLAALRESRTLANTAIYVGGVLLER